MGKRAYAYILASKPRGTLYIGVTSDLIKRLHEHRSSQRKGFTARFNVKRLVYFEALDWDRRGTCPRKTTEALAPALENQVNRRNQP